MRKLEPKRLRAREVTQIRERLRGVAPEFYGDVAALLQHVAELRDHLHDKETEIRDLKQQVKALSTPKYYAAMDPAAGPSKVVITQVEVLTPEEREEIKRKVRERSQVAHDPPPDIRLPREEDDPA